MPISRRSLLTAGVQSAATLALAGAAAAEPKAAAPTQTAPLKIQRIGVISSRIKGQPQKTNGHTWHFAQGFHPECNLEAVKKYLDPGSAREFAQRFRNPKVNFDQLPFVDTRIACYYEQDPAVAAMFCEAFPGVEIAKSPEELAANVDAVWLGDASGYGEDHFDLIAPALQRGLPTFCDKPIGGTVPLTRQILDFAVKHKAPIMSSSLFRHEWGMEQALRMRDSGDFGPIHFVHATLMGGYSESGWLMYSQHPIWSVITLKGPGCETVTAYARENTAHAFLTYPDSQPASIWYGRPDCTDYCETAVHFQKKVYRFTPGIEGDFWHGHHYEMFRMAHAFLQMVRTGVEPVPHKEILEVTAIMQAGVKSMAEGNRPVKLAEVLG